jgi:hypothetical protein
VAGGFRRPCRDAWRHQGDVARLGLAARLGGRHGRRGGFTPVSRSGYRRGAVTQVSGAAAMMQARQRSRQKGAAVRLPCRGAERAEPGELRVEEGKADKRAPLVSCPGRKVKRRDGEAGWAGPWLPWAAWVALRFAGKREKEAGLAWAVGPWGVYMISF